jgi:hypothetical protein
VSWNLRNRDLFLSSSWDDTIKLWSVARPGSLQTFLGHTYCVYHVAWCGGGGGGEDGRGGRARAASGAVGATAGASGARVLRAPAQLHLTPLRPPPPTPRSPHHGDVFLSASGDTSVRLWDLRQPQPTLLLPAHAFEVRPGAAGEGRGGGLGARGARPRGWDLRQPQPTLLLPAHAFRGVANGGGPRQGLGAAVRGARDGARCLPPWAAAAALPAASPDTPSMDPEQPPPPEKLSPPKGPQRRLVQVQRLHHSHGVDRQVHQGEAKGEGGGRPGL